MQIPIYRNWLISIVLNKGRYSFCFNPHILLCKRQVCGYGLRFPARWSIWNVELDRKKRVVQRRERKDRKLCQANRCGIVGGTLSVFRNGSPWQTTLSVFVTKKGIVKVYFGLPYCNTKLREYKSERLRARYFGVLAEG